MAMGNPHIFRAEYSHFTDRLARFVDWCIQERLRQMMVRGELQVVKIHMGETRQAHMFRFAKAMASGAKVKERAKYGIENLKSLGVSKLREVAGEFVKLGKAFEAKAREMGVLGQIGNVRAAGVFFRSMLAPDCPFVAAPCRA